MRTYEEQVINLNALSLQEGTPGTLPVRVVADMLVIRDELIQNLQRVVETEVREQRLRRRNARIAQRAMR